MYKTILIPVELGQKEKAAGMVAIARRLGGEEAKLIFVTVVEEVPAYVLAQLPEGIIEESRNEARSTLAALAKELGVAAEIEVRVGHAPSGILAVADEKGADVIIVASHRPGLQDYLLGSTAARVVRHATCPVFIDR